MSNYWKAWVTSLNPHETDLVSAIEGTLVWVVILQRQFGGAPGHMEMLSRKFIIESKLFSILGHFLSDLSHNQKQLFQQYLLLGRKILKTNTYKELAKSKSVSQSMKQ